MKLLLLVATVAMFVYGTRVGAQSHVGDCSKHSGITKARCERHEKMFAQCGSVKGDAHFACDREFLLANPLDCRTLSGTDRSACDAEVAAFKACESNPGRAFVGCVRERTKASPMGH